MNAFLQMLAEKIISFLEVFFRRTNQEHSTRPFASEEASSNRLQARLAHRLSAG